MLKTLNKLEMEGNFLNLMKAINEKSIVNNVLNGKRLKAFTLRFLNRTKTSTLVTSIQHCTGDCRQGIWARKRKKYQPDWKEDAKLFLIFDHTYIQKILRSSHTHTHTIKANKQVQQGGRTQNWCTNQMYFCTLPINNQK